MWELDHKDGWVPQNWCFQTVVLKKTLERPLDCKEIKPVNPKGNQPWIFIGRMMLKLKLQYFGHLMQRADSLEKTLILGKIEGRGEGNNRGWDGWMASPTQWTWIWAHSGRQWSYMEARHAVVHGVASQAWLSDWTPPPPPSLPNEPYSFPRL